MIILRNQIFFSLKLHDLIMNELVYVAHYYNQGSNFKFLIKYESTLNGKSHLVYMFARIPIHKQIEKDCDLGQYIWCKAHVIFPLYNTLSSANVDVL